MISMGLIMQWDNQISAGQALFLLDACVSGLAVPTVMSGSTSEVVEQLAKPGHHLLTAGTADEFSDC